MKADSIWLVLALRHSHEKYTQLRNMLDELNTISVIHHSGESDQSRRCITNILDMKSDLITEANQSGADLVLIIEIVLKIIDISN